MIEIRKATLADAAGIIRVGRDVFAGTFGHSVPEEELLAYLDSAYTGPLIAAELKDGTKDTFVAIHHDHRPGSLYTGADSTDAAESSNSSSRSRSSASTDGQGGVVVGFAQLTRGSSAAEPCVASLAHAASTVELQRLYVDTAHHGRGIGSRLAAAMEDIARREGFTHMWLGVWEENSAAARVYAKLGYSPIGFHDFAVGSIVQRDDILMKQLAKGPRLAERRKSKTRQENPHLVPIKRETRTRHIGIRALPPATAENQRRHRHWERAFCISGLPIDGDDYGTPDTP
ncbi:hypothetical protein LLEC1_02990 [Akanthomyces lecanii]|uniref:N-acetyltransferase domain-containing protein n=1 Tax=Cordyceps confragosa TaxID=2714763 RepID=A0A179I6M6_CORDF|nr:hypothetical protein LLEC1_02990 [Akanthomyces lecanii]